MIRRLYYNIRIGFLHAAFHRHLRKMTYYRTKRDIVNFKKSIYRAEDAWRKLTYFKQQLK